MPLIENLNDLVEDEYAHLIEELRLAVAESGYNVTELCALAQIEPKTYYRLMSGKDVKMRDTMLRLLFAVGGRIEIRRTTEEGERPFRVELLASTGSRRSPSAAASPESGRRAGAGVRNESKVDEVSARKASKQRRKRPPENPVTVP